MKVNFWEGFHNFSLKLLQIIYINFLWLFFTSIGLFVLGLFPATIALFTVMRNLLLHNEKPITTTFWKTYKQEWLKGNGYALVSYSILIILAIDFYAIYLIDSLQILLIPTFLLAFLIFGTLLFFFPVYVHFDLTFFAMIKQAFLFTITSPITVVLNCISIVCLYGVFNIIPGALPLFMGSVISYFAMKWSLSAFGKMEKKKTLEGNA